MLDCRQCFENQHKDKVIQPCIWSLALQKGKHALARNLKYFQDWGPTESRFKTSAFITNTLTTTFCSFECLKKKKKKKTSTAIYECKWCTDFLWRFPQVPGGVKALRMTANLAQGCLHFRTTSLFLWLSYFLPCQQLPQLFLRSPKRSRERGRGRDTQTKESTLKDQTAAVPSNDTILYFISWK